jgi:hypothetical protein
MLSTNKAGTINDFHLLVCANATDVAGPLIALDDAVNTRWEQNADLKSVANLPSPVPQRRPIP